MLAAARAGGARPKLRVPRRRSRRTAPGELDARARSGTRCARPASTSASASSTRGSARARAADAADGDAARAAVDARGPRPRRSARPDRARAVARHVAGAARGLRGRGDARVGRAAGGGAADEDARFAALASAPRGWTAREAPRARERGRARGAPRARAASRCARSTSPSRSARSSFLKISSLACDHERRKRQWATFKAWLAGAFGEPRCSTGSPGARPRLREADAAAAAGAPDAAPPELVAVIDGANVGFHKLNHAGRPSASSTSRSSGSRATSSG